MLPFVSVNVQQTHTTATDISTGTVPGTQNTRMICKIICRQQIVAVSCFINDLEDGGKY